MIFEYNENSCNAIISFHKERIQAIESDIDFLKRELNKVTQSAVGFAFMQAIAKQEYDKSCCEQKISEMQQLLDGMPKK